MFADPINQPQFYRDVPMKRALAWAVDTLLILALSLVVLPFTAFTAIFFYPLFLLVVGFLYDFDFCPKVYSHSVILEKYTV